MEHLSHERGLALVPSSALPSDAVAPSEGRTQRNARVAGITFLVYYATSLADMSIYGHATLGTGMTAKLGSVAAHAVQMRTASMLSMLSMVWAITLAVALGR